MARNGISVKVIRNYIPNILQNVRVVVPQTTRERLERVRDRAKDIVPVDSGELRDSIGVVMTSPTNGMVIADKEYAAYVELGTSRTPAQPYLIPALNEEKDRLPDAVYHALFDGVPK